MNYKPKNQISYRYNRNKILVSKSSLNRNLTNSWMVRVNPFPHLVQRHEFYRYTELNTCNLV